MGLASQPPRETQDLPSGAELRVLVVDEEARAAALEALIARGDGISGWIVERRTDLEGALRALRGGGFHACLLAHDIGGKPGIELIVAAREESSPVPFVLLGGGGRASDLEAIQAGADDFLDRDGLDAGALEKAVRYAVEHARVRADLFRRTRRDGLTGLHNRGSIEERIECAIARAERSARLVGVCVIDLDGFKAVNDRCGHAAGDELLRSFAARLKEVVRAYDAVGRLGGDEFAVVLEELGSEAEARRTIARIEHVTARADLRPAGLPPVSASVGLAMYPQGGTTSADLLRVADEAMYRAKKASKQRTSLELAEGFPRRPEEFRAAASSGALQLAFQPQVDLGTGATVGFEALARWNPSGQPIRPIAEVVGWLERIGAVAELDLWVLEQAIARIAQESLPRVAVNLSPASLIRPDFLSRAAALLPVAPGRIELELTESAVLFALDPGSMVSNSLHVLRALGLRIALDDFGVGQSSLLRFRDLPIDVVKVDRAFTPGFAGDERSRAILEAVVALGRRLSVEVVAEGIETSAEAEEIRALGVARGQGFFFSKPLLDEELTQWLARSASG